MSIFDERINYKPFEYPECDQFIKAIQGSYWVVDEFNFTKDINDFNVSISDEERDCIKKCMLAISQIEVSVKKFWGSLHDRLPKPEFNAVGAVFSESELRHSEAYSKLLEVLGLNDQFEKIFSIPCIIGRVKYLKKYQTYLKDEDPRKFIKALVLFSLFVENVSLFTQFFMISNFKKHKNLFEDMSAVVNASAQEEQLHAEFGIYVVNKIKEEFPELWDYSLKQSIVNFARKAYDAECKVIDWILNKKCFIKPGLVKDFLKYRFNESLEKIDIEPIFQVKDQSEFQWYVEQLYTSTHGDFFVSRPSTYSMNNKSFTSEDLF